MFPFGVPPEAVSAVPPDTVNRLLLHGARYHDREFVYAEGDGEGAARHPDWRIDRHSIRIALALAESHRITIGSVVALELSFSLERLITERAVWGLGATSAFEPREAGDLVISGNAAVNDLLEQGAALDTPERASRFRTTARDVPPSRLASIERDGVERSQAAWVRDIEDVLLHDGPRRGRRRVLSPGTPVLEARVLAFAGWTDGLTETVLGLE